MMQSLLYTTVLTVTSSVHSILRTPVAMPRIPSHTQLTVQSNRYTHTAQRYMFLSVFSAKNPYQWQIPPSESSTLHVPANPTISTTPSTCSLILPRVATPS